MRCRRIKTWTDANGKEHRTVVWFGSYGINDDGTAKFFSSNNKHDNFSDEQQAVADSLTQRLSVIRGELWYMVSYGLPLFEKTKSKALMDSAIIQTIQQHSDVVEVSSFTSRVINHRYAADIVVQTTFGSITLSV